MTNIKQPKFAKSLQFLAISLFMLFSPFDIKAQNNSAVNVVGIDWRTISSVINLDASTTTTTHYYYLGNQGKIRCIIVIGKTPGGTNQRVLRRVYNPITHQYEMQMVLEFVPTPGFTSSNTDYGTYIIKDNSVFIDFPAFTIKANVSSGSMKGILVDKKSGAKEEWLAEAVSHEKSANDLDGTDVQRVIQEEPAGGNNGNSNVRESREDRSSNLSGTWEGSYSCGQGLTNLDLVIFQKNSSEIHAVFNFYANGNNPSVPSGSFKMIGTYNDRNNKIVLIATDWINQPFGYVKADLMGKVLQGNTKISGKILHSDCSTFTVERK